MNNSKKKNEILNQIDRILESAIFKRSKILAKFLHFIVSETLSGNAVQMKEYTIGISVLNRNSDFDPKMDGIVRIHAVRLRKLLDEYYEGQGKNDPIKISIPKGGYLPLFEIIEKGKSKLLGEQYAGKDVPAKSIIAVVPFNQFESNATTSETCKSIHQELCMDLSWFPEIDVVSEFQARDILEKEPEFSKLLLNQKVDYCISGKCRSQNGILNITIELSSVPIGRQPIWTDSMNIYDIEKKETTYKNLIQKVISIMCGVLGIIYRNKQNVKLEQDYDELGAIFWHNQYHTDFSEAAIMQALHALDFGLKKNPNNSLLTSFMAELYLNFNLMDLQQGVNFLEKAIELGKRSVYLDPTNQHAYGVLAAASVHNKSKKDFEYYSKKCLMINPNSPVYKGLIGFINILGGQYQRGYNLMSEAIQQIAYYPFDINVGFCLYNIYKKRYNEAHLWAQRIKRSNLIWDPILRITCLVYLNQSEDLIKAKEELFAIAPHFSERAKIIINIPLQDVVMKKTILDALLTAGIDIKQ